MVQEMNRRGCKGVGGIHWDEMTIKEGIVLCKETGELVGFEDLNISHELNKGPHHLENEDEDSIDSSSESSGSDTTSTVFDSGFSSDSIFSDKEQTNQPTQKNQTYLPLFLFIVRGGFFMASSSFPLHKINHLASM